MFCGGLIGLAVVSYTGTFDNIPLTLVDYQSENQLPPFALPNVTVHNIEVS